MVKYVSLQEEVEIPSDVTITLSEDNEIKISGENGSLTKDFSHVKSLKLELIGLQSGGKRFFPLLEYTEH